MTSSNMLICIEALRYSTRMADTIALRKLVMKCGVVHVSSAVKMDTELTRQDTRFIKKY